MYITEEQSFRKLENSLGDPQANAVRDYVTVKIDRMKEPLATRADMEGFARQADLELVKQDVSTLKQDVSELKQDVSFLKQDISNLDMKLNTNLQLFIAEVKLMVTDLKAEILMSKIETIKWTIATILVISGIITTVIIKLI